MKKLLLLFTVLLGVVFTSKSQTPPQFKFITESHNFGKIQKNKPVTVIYRFTNIGDAPLIITDAQADCGCTTPVLSPAKGTAIKKGQSGTIKVTYDAANIGTFTKNVTLTANTKEKTKVISLKGEVLNTTK